jgi:hypothetical protein
MQAESSARTNVMFNEYSTCYDSQALHVSIVLEVKAGARRMQKARPQPLPVYATNNFGCLRLESINVPIL